MCLDVVAAALELPFQSKHAVNDAGCQFVQMLQVHPHCEEHVEREILNPPSGGLHSNFAI